MKTLSWAGAAIASSIINKSFYIFSYTNRPFPGVPIQLRLLSFPSPGRKCYHFFCKANLPMSINKVTWHQVLFSSYSARASSELSQSENLTSTDCMPPIGQSVASLVIRVSLSQQSTRYYAVREMGAKNLPCGPTMSCGRFCT